MSRKLPQPILKEDFDKLLEASKKQLEEYWQPRKEEYKPRGKQIQQYLICMILGFGAGMRISEIVGLKKTYSYTYKGVKKEQICDIEALRPEQIENNFIRVLGAKGGKDRQVPLPIKLMKKAGITKYQFLINLPIKMKRSAIQRYIVIQGNKVLGKRISFHKLRHGFVSYCLEQGMPIHQVQMLAGHSRMDTTGLYAHANPKDTLEKVGGLDW